MLPPVTGKVDDIMILKAPAICHVLHVMFQIRFAQYMAMDYAATMEILEPLQQSSAV